MARIRTRSSTRRTNPNNHHSYVNPADQFNLAFGAEAINQQAQQAPGGDDDDADDASFASREDGSSNSSSSVEPTQPISLSTFNNHQAKQTRLLVWIFDKKAEYLHPDFMQRLADIDAHTDFQVSSHNHTKYLRIGGRKSLEVRTRENRIKILRNEAKRALGTPGKSPPRPTVSFESLEANIDRFDGFLYSVTKENEENGDLQFSGCKEFKSALIHLFHRYRYNPSTDVVTEVKTVIDGMNKYRERALRAARYGDYSY